MAQIKGGASSDLVSVETTHKTLRTVGRPMESGTLGSYRISLLTGILPAALAANSEIAQFRWSDATRKCLVRRVIVSAAVSTTAFIAGVPPTLELRFARAWTAVGTGGTGITFGTNDSKRRTSFGTSLFVASDMRVATTAALGAGTKTLDGTALGGCVGNTGVATATTQLFPPGTVLWDRGTPDAYPLLLATQEGLVVRSVQIPGTGTWTATIDVEWDEVDPATVAGAGW